MKARLAVAETMLSLQKIRIKFRLFQGLLSILNSPSFLKSITYYYYNKYSTILPQHITATPTNRSVEGRDSKKIECRAITDSSSR